METKRKRKKGGNDTLQIANVEGTKFKINEY